MKGQCARMEDVYEPVEENDGVEDVAMDVEEVEPTGAPEPAIQEEVAPTPQPVTNTAGKPFRKVKKHVHPAGVHKVVVAAPKPGTEVSAYKSKSQSPEINRVETMILEYLDLISKVTADCRIKAQMRFADICNYIVQNQKTELYDVVFKQLFMTKGAMMAPDVVFDFLHKNRMQSVDKERIIALYTAFVALAEHLKSPKARGYSIDLDRLVDKFGDGSIKEYILSQIV